ncbi:FHA domain-containing protein [Sorangium sp. So ce204]|uniref:FHA domain-containing protein n=1 Tax=Sorangium sp. So ce204 TaxID=3133288 RepID=UPI003F63A686
MPFILRAMGVVRHVSSGRSVVLAAHAIVGRAPSSAVRLTDHAASNDHAAVSWKGERWQVRDLASTNGTSVDGRPLEAGTNVDIKRGSVLQFGGSAERWELTDDGGPVVVARALATGEERQAVDGLLALPDADSVLVSIFVDTAGRWLIEGSDGSQRPVSDKEEITVAEERWMLTVPPASPIAGTYKTAPSLSLVTCTLRFHVSRDEEHVRIEAVDGGDALEIGQFAPFYALLLLARARRKDAARGELPEDEQGWIHVVDLARQLRVEEKYLNVLLFRARQAFAKADLGSEIVQRRRREIRIATGRVEELKA